MHLISFDSLAKYYKYTKADFENWPGLRISLVPHAPFLPQGLLGIAKSTPERANETRILTE
jgi:hypothetical protein